MKMRVFYIIAGILIILGAIAISAGLLSGSFDFHRIINEPAYTQKTYESEGNIDSIEIDDSNISIYLGKSTDSKVHIKYYENSDTTYDINEDDGRLVINKDDNRHWYDYIFNIRFTLQKIELSVLIPDGFSGDIDAQTSNGKIVMEDIESGNIKADASNGEISAENLLVSDLLQVITSNGAINMQDVKGDEIECSTSNGRISVESVEFTSGLMCETSNGAIRGSIVGELADFTITARTSNGDCNLPVDYEGGDKYLDLKTSNGDIDIDFE